MPSESKPQTNKNWIYTRLLLVLCLSSLINYSLISQESRDEINTLLDSAADALLHEDFNLGKTLIDKIEHHRNQEAFIDDDLITARLSNLYAFYYYYVDQVDSSRQRLVLSEKLLKNLLDQDPSNKLVRSELAQCFNLHGYCDFRIARTEDGVVNLKRALDILGSDSVNVSLYNELIHNLGTFYVLSGENNLGIEYLTLSMNREPLEEMPQGFRTLCAIGGAYRSLSILDKALEFQTKGMLMAKNLHGEDHNYTAETYSGLSNIYYELKKYEEAKAYITKAIKIFENMGYGRIPVVSRMYISLGLYNANLKLWQEAIAAYNISLDIADALPPDRHYLKAEGFSRLGTVYHRLGDLEKAYELLTKSAEILEYNADSPDRYKSVRFIQLRNYFTQFIPILEDLAQSDSPLVSLQELEDFYEDAIGFEEYMINSMTSERSKISQAYRADDIYESYINFQIRKNDLNAAVNIAEKNKVRQLREYLDQIRLEKELGVSDEMIQERTSIEDRINQLETSIYQLNKNEQSERFDSLQTELIAMKEKELNFRNEFSKSYPSYTRYLNTNNLHLNLISGLVDSKCILTYFAGDNTYVSFLITTDTILHHVIADRTGIDSLIMEYRSTIYDYWLDKNHDNDSYLSRNQKMIEISHYLYRTLIGSFGESFSEEIVIVPDGKIGLIPFETLIQNNSDCTDDLRKCDFLVKNHNLAYSYSIDLWQKNQETTSISSATKEMILFAPSYQSNDDLAMSGPENIRTGLGTLNYNTQEVQNISELFNSEVFEGESASKQNFNEKVSDYRIIHLASHAKSNFSRGEFSYLAFTNTNTDVPNDHLLYANELFKKDISADMVVLSACETGLGEQLRGEGIIGLARGFFFAGTSNVVASLWSVNDVYTADFMTSFYKNIKDGLSKSESLRQTKLSFLENRLSADPYYWSPFVSYGNDQPLYKTQKRMKYLMPMLAVILLGAIAVFIYNK